MFLFRVVLVCKFSCNLFLSQFGQDPEFLWRCAKSYHQVADIRKAEGSTEEGKALDFKAAELGEAALAIGPHLSSVHKW